MSSLFKLRLPPAARLRGPSPLSASERWLLAALLAESAFFSVAANRFFGLVNFFEILRFSVELGLLSVALTPILITGGIDLSVGSTVGLTAVILGAASADLHLGVAGLLAIGILVGCLCGAINALMVAGLRLPPLIVTLGTFTLYRGVAEGITHGALSYTGFPQAFLALGQGYLFGIIPAQLPVFLLVAAGFAILLHFSVMGRGIYAIGLNSAGARYAGIPVRRHLFVLYLASGIISGLAGIILVAHLGLAKSDLGTGYELQAITAVVLGGTSVFGGRGTLFGSVLGLLLLTVLQDGLHLLALPSELTGVLTGLLLLTIVSIEQVRRRHRSSPDPARPLSRAGLLFRSPFGRAVSLALCGMVIVALAFGLARRRSHAGNPSISPGNSQSRHFVIAVMPKAKGDPYFISARAGAEQAARELGVELIWDGPTSLDASQQNELVESWITMHVDAIVVAVENSGSISTVLRNARRQGIAVLTWDADAQTDARDYFLNQATPEGIADALTDEAERLLPEGGQFAIITGALSAENQNEWIACIKRRIASRHSRLTLAAVEPSDDDRDKAFTQTQTILKVDPQVRLVMDISAPAVPGSAEAVLQSGRKDVDVIGLSLPTICRPYIRSGVVQTIVLWNTHDLGYLTVYAGWLDAQHRISSTNRYVAVGRLGNLTIRGSEIILGTPLIIDKANIDQLNF